MSVLREISCGTKKSKYSLDKSKVLLYNKTNTKISKENQMEIHVYIAQDGTIYTERMMSDYASEIVERYYSDATTRTQQRELQKIFIRSWKESWEHQVIRI